MIPSFSTKNYIGLAAGALAGGYSQDPFDNPFTGVAGAGIGAIMGSVLETSLKEQLGKFKPTKLNRKIQSYGIRQVDESTGDMIRKFMEPHKDLVRPVKANYGSNSHYTRALTKIKSSYSHIIKPYSSRGKLGLNITDFIRDDEKFLKVGTDRLVTLRRTHRALSTNGFIDELVNLRYDNDVEAHYTIVNKNSMSRDLFRANLFAERDRLGTLLDDYGVKKGTNVAKLRKYALKFDEGFESNRWVHAMSNFNVSTMSSNGNKKASRNIAYQFMQHQKMSLTKTAGTRKAEENLARKQLIVREQLNRYLSDIGDKDLTLTGHVTPEAIESVIQKAEKKGYSAAAVRAATRKSATYNARLGTGTISKELMGSKINAPISITKEEHFSSFKKMLVDNGVGEVEADRKARGMAFAFKGHKVKQGSNFIEVNGRKVMATQYTPEGVRVAGVSDLDKFSIAGREKFTVVRQGNILSAAVSDPSFSMGFTTLEADKVSRKAERVFLDEVGALSLKGYDPEELISQYAQAKGRALTQSELDEILDVTQSLYQNDADSSALQAELISNQVDRQKTMYIDKDGSLGIRKTRMTPQAGERNSEFGRVVEKLEEKDKLGRNPLIGTSQNTVGITSNLDKLKEFDPKRATEYGAGFSNIRKTRPTSPNKYAVMYDFFGDGGKHNWMLNHSQGTMKMNVSDELAKAFAYKFGSQYSIDDGKGIALRDLASAEQKMRYTLGVMDNGEAFNVHSVFRDAEGNSLINDDFLKADFATQKSILAKNTNLVKDGKIILGKGNLIGTDENGMDLRVGRYVSEFEVEGIKLTERGLELHGTGYSNPQDWAKFFSTTSKAGNALTDKETMLRMSSLAMAEGRGDTILSADGRLLANAAEDAFAKYGHLVEDVGYLDTWKESKLSAVRGHMTQKDITEAKYKTGGAADLDQYINNLSYRGTDKVQQLKAANSQRLLDLVRVDYRQRSEILETIALNNFNKTDKDAAKTAMMEALNNLRVTGETGSRARQVLFDMLGETFGADEENAWKQGRSLIRFTPEDLEEIHGPGKLAGASHLQRAQMIDSGFSREMLGKLYNQNLGALHEMQLLEATGEGKTALIDSQSLSKQQMNKVITAFGMRPEERREFLERGENAINLGKGTFTTFSTESGHAVPMSFLSTNRTGVNSYGSGLHEYATDVEQARRAVLGSELLIKGGKTEATMAYQKETLGTLARLNSERRPTIIKEWGKLSAKIGTLNIADSVGGAADDFVKSLGSFSEKNIGFMSESSMNDLKKRVGSKAEFRLADIDKDRFPGIQRLEINEGSGWRSYKEIYSREPVQGPHSVMVMDMFVDKNLKGEFQNHRFFSSESKLINLLSKLDYDADTPAFTSVLGLDEGEMTKISQIQAQTNKVGEEIMPLMKQLDAKYATEGKPLDTLLSSAKSFEQLERLGKEKGTLRKEVAGLVTKLNADIGMALRTSNADKGMLMTSRALLYGMTENLLKASHRSTEDFEATRSSGIMNLLDLVNKRAEGTDRVVNKSFQTDFKQSIDDLFGMSKERIEKLMANPGSGFTQAHLNKYEEAKNILAEATDVSLDKEIGARVNPYLGSRQLGEEAYARILESDIGKALPDANIMMQEIEPPRIAQAKATARDIGSALSAAVKNNKKTLAFGGAALAGFAIMNAASPSDPPASSIPKSTVNAQPLEPRMDRKYYTRKIKQQSLDVKVRGNTSNNMQQTQDAIIGKDAVVRADINIKRA